ncbi:hypothetical protein LJR225_004581 [Phenylobacterium sp. LjRoot225]|uniref:CC_3452 family protein n=1 Tax=Phenylobacterium sp. LjRoot225 TaxID=3342285 RepID=UPI003ED0AF17
MKPFTLMAVAAFLASAVVSTAAAAGPSTGPVVAKLQTPIAKRVRPIAGEAVFVCEADTCSAATPTSATNSVPSCRELARRVGALASFGADGAALDAEGLARCNLAARK